MLAHRTSLVDRILEILLAFDHHATGADLTYLLERFLKALENLIVLKSSFFDGRKVAEERQEEVVVIFIILCREVEAEAGVLVTTTTAERTSEFSMR